MARASRRREETVEDSSSPRPSRARRTNLAGLDLDEEEDDEEYSEQQQDDVDVDIDEEDEEESYTKEDSEEEDEDEAAPMKSRKRKATSDLEDGDDDVNEDEDEDEEEEDGDDGEEENDGEEEKDGEEGNEEEKHGEDEEREKEETETDSSKEKRKPIQVRLERRGPKKRGRKKTKITILEDGAFDEDGNPMNINDDEVVIDDEDPKGLEKVDEFGQLNGGRRYRVKTFTLLNKGKKLYMISTEPARLVGFRDSYLLFKTHRSLFKKVCTDEEKMDLIDRHIIPNSYKGRSVNLVTARSIYREFGAKIVIDGKKVTDDFWEQKAIDNGDVPGEYADPGEVYIYPNKAALNPADPANNSNATPIAGTATVNYQSDPTWMYQIALKTREYNSKLLEQRSQIFFRGVKDVYTGLNFYPLSTQPTRSSFTKVGNTENGSVIYDAKFHNPNIRKKATGLKDIPSHIFDDIEDEETKNAILEQQEYEKSL